MIRGVEYPCVMPEHDGSDKQTVFFITRIGTPGSAVRERTEDVAKHVLRPVVEERSLRILRADEDPSPGRISERIVRHIDEASVIVADVSGLSANVFYELGIAHSRQKPVIILVDDPMNIPFDTIDQNHIVLGEDGVLGATAAESARERFSAALDIALDPGYQPSSPVSAADLQQSLESIDDPMRRTVLSLKEEVRSLQAFVARSDYSGQRGRKAAGDDFATKWNKTNLKRLNLRVSELKTQLAVAGLYAGPFDDEVSPELILAVGELQNAGGIAVDGIFGPDSRRVLDQRLAEPRVEEG